MVNQSIRVLFRMNAGPEYRLASAEQKQKHGEVLTDILKKWNSSGVKLLSNVGFLGDGPGGYVTVLMLVLRLFSRTLGINCKQPYP